MRTLTMAAALATAMMIGSSASAQSTELNGAGATFPKTLYQKWIQDYNSAQANVKVDYQPKGSGFGITNITNRTIQFAGSDAPMTDKQLKEAPAKVLHLPTVSGPVVLVYNLPNVKELTLNGEVIAGIFEGKIEKWNAPQIAAINNGVALPDTDISIVHRSDGSGTTWIFTNYLSKVSADWKTKVGNQASVNWPAGQGANGNDGVAGAIKNTEGAIGYCEIAFANSAKLPYANVINKAGKTVRPSIDAVNEAAKNSIKELPDDFRVSITNAAGDGSYPICGFTYFLVYEDLSYLKNKDQATELVKFLTWCETKGQDQAAPDFGRLPEDIQKKVIERLKTIVCDGQPVQP